MDPDALLAITGGLAAVLGALGTWLRGRLKRDTGAAKDVADLPSMHRRLIELEAKWAELELEAELEKERAHEAALAEVNELKRELAERDRRDFEDSSPAGNSQLMNRSSE